MRKLALFALITLPLLLAFECGDNIHRPDASNLPEITEVPEDPGLPLPPDMTPDPVPSPDARDLIEECQDRHEPKQEHKCQHSEDLPPGP